MPNNADRDSTSRWLVAMIVAILIAIVVTWADSGGWSGTNRRGETASGNRPAHHVTGTSAGNSGANDATTRAASTTSAVSNQAPSGQVLTGLQSKTKNAGVSTTTTGANLSADEGPNASGPLNSTAPVAPTAAGGQTR